MIRPCRETKVQKRQLAFGKINGHYNVPPPRDGAIDATNGEYLLYKWVER